MTNNLKLIEIVKNSEGWKQFASKYSSYADIRNWEDTVMFEFYEDEFGYSIETELTAIDHGRLNFGDASYQARFSQVNKNLVIDSQSSIEIDDEELSLPIVKSKNHEHEMLDDMGYLLEGKIMHKEKSSYKKTYVLAK